MNKISAFIFDVDGVLVDSVHYHFEAWRKMFSEQDIVFTFKDYVSRVNGLPRITGIRAMMPNITDAQAEKLAEIKQRFFLEMVDRKHPKPLSGVVDFLTYLKKKKYLLAAASSSKNSPHILAKAHITSYFDKIISGSDFSKPKPDPEIFLTASRRLGVDPDRCVVIEDAATGIEAGNNAGMKTVGLLTSQDGDIKDLADLTISSLDEYEEILQSFELGI